MVKNAKENNLIKNTSTSLERLESTSSLSSDRHQLRYTLLKPSSSGKIYNHQADIYFLKHNEPYFHIGYAIKIKAGAS